MNAFKKAFSTMTVIATIAWSIGLSAFVPSANAAIASGSLIKASGAAVYYLGANGKRYVFPNETTYKTWYANFYSVVTITDSELAAIQIGGNVVFRPGVRLGKVTTDPKVYAISSNGTLRWVKTEAVAVALYGANWGAMVSDIPDAFFTNYTYGADINTAADYNPAAETAAATSINVNQNIGGTTPPTPVGGALQVSLAADTPAGQSVPAGTTPATNVAFTKVNFTAGSNAVIINKITVTRSGLSADTDLAAVKIWDGATQLDTAQTLNSAHQATFNVNKTVAANSTWSAVIAADLCSLTNCPNISGSEIKFGVAANTDINSNASSVMGAPVFGNTMVATNISVGSLLISQGAQMPSDGNGAAPWDTSYDIGDNKVVFAVKLGTGSVEDVKVWNLTFESGDNSTIQNGDLSDITLINDTTGQTIATLPSLDSKGNAVFDLSANPLLILKGSTRDLIVKAKIQNGASRVIAFDINDGTSFLIRATGVLYGFGVAMTNNGGWTASAGIGNGVNINQGTLTVSKASTSAPAGNIAIGGTDLSLADYSFEVKGEDIRIGTTVVELNVVSGVAGNCSVIVDNVKLVNAKTGVVLAGPVTPTGTIAGTVCTATFSSSYELPNGANTVRVTANTTSSIVNGNTVSVDLKGGSFANVKGLTSNKTITPTPALDVAGNLQTVKGALVVVQMGGSPIAGNIVKGKVSFPVAYVGLDASAGGEDVRISTLALENTGGTGVSDVADNNDYVNGRLINVATGAQIGQTVQPSGNILTFTFSGDELVVLKTQQVNLVLQIDVLSTISTGEDFGFRVSTLTGTGKASATSATVSPALPTTPSPTQNAITSGVLKVTVDANTATSAQLVSGSTGNSIATYKLEAVDEAVDVTDIYLVAADPANFAGADDVDTQATRWGSNIASVDAYVNGVKVGSTLSATANGIMLLSVPAGTILVPKNGSVVLTFKANLQTKTNVTSNDYFSFGIADSVGTAGDAYGTKWSNYGTNAAAGYEIVAKGQDSGSALTPVCINSTGYDGATATAGCDTTAATGKINGGKVMSVHDGALTVTMNAASPSGLKSIATNQELMRVNLTATGDDVTINEMELTVSESCTATLTLAAVRDASDSSILYVGSDAIATLIPGDEAGESVLTIAAGSTKTVKIEGDTTAGDADCDPAADDTIQITIGAAGGTVAGVNYQAVDGIDVGTTANLPQAKDLPLVGNSISF